VPDIKILVPLHCNKVYSIAANEFQKLYEAITGIKLDIITEDDEKSDLVVIGSDAVNSFAASLILGNKFEGFKIRYGTDDYHICSVKFDKRNIMFLAGGRGRSTLYAVYDFFEKICGCRYFWDGDIIPKANDIPITDVFIVEKPRFEYRGLRYFAHRGLHRFQAEHWSIEDWQKEIDWMLKKRLNLFMLRIGNDDIFQKAFSDIVNYPSNEEKINSSKKDHNDRTPSWSLQYRGELRKKILAYAFERDLMHPEDCGTMTHWYSPTPKQFLEKIRPKTLNQLDGDNNDYEKLIWDIRDEKNFENYFRLTEAHIREYGKPELFHTIGYAERKYSDDKIKNIRMKQYIYKKIISYLKEHYPNAPLLIASWDLWMNYSSEDVKNLISMLDKNQVIILDYTSDTIRENNFTNWGVIGNFPYIFGIFHGYSRNSDIRGNYRLTEERLATAANDDYCKGLVFWPELSHSDTFMTEYFSGNSWVPLTLTMDQRIEKYCQDRYCMSVNKMTDVWKKFMPIVYLMSWNMYNALYNTKELFFLPFEIMGLIKNNRDYLRGFDVNEALKLVANAGYILDTLKDLDDDTYRDDFIRRDIFDIARTILGRYIHTGLILVISFFQKWKSEGEINPDFYKCCDIVMNLLNYLQDLLGEHDDYSMVATFEGLKKVSPVNPVFENTLKCNASCDYHRSYSYENVKWLYIPEMKLVLNWLEQNLNEGNRRELKYCEKYNDLAKQIKEQYFNTPLSTLGKHDQHCIREILNDAANEISRLQDIVL
jgi:hypothetical protein